MYLFIFLPVIGGLIGWLTNIIALRLLFRPLTPVTIPFSKYSFQGLIPKRKLALSRSIGDIVEKELLSRRDILQQVNYDSMEREVLSASERIIKGWTEEKLTNFIPPGIKKILHEYIADLVKKELSIHVKVIMRDMIHKAWDEVNISKMVEDKMNKLSLERVEQMIIFIASKELKHIEYLGAALGFFIGIVQAGVVYILQ
ncbi:DUF445 domain-containing protein [Candidatus Contubernalis alkaliaceticus]|uniref:DUF445 domain-containing protein n=1 Tax=Candidatus Contubernalis alkaliaceticus TaxID=338645 RepID=UPI001F4C465C|nr:DUF445 family protein [Candidatus Contubernalis alkalaceticus]UNC92653.1 DUF445 family protein [Candidatus Contubernalis alkalaceticus]